MVFEPLAMNLREVCTSLFIVNKTYDLEILEQLKQYRDNRVCWGIAGFKEIWQRRWFTR